MRTILIIIAIATLTGAVAWQLLGYIGTTLCAPAQCTMPVPNDLPVQPIAIHSQSGATLKGWELTGRPELGVILLFHSLRANRASMAERARFLWNHGFAVILCDFQAHGESQGSKITFGFLESLDVEAVLSYARQKFPTKKIGAIGVSLGGASIILRKNPSPLNAVVLEAVYPTVEEATRDRIRIRLGTLTYALTPILLTQLKRTIGITKDKLRPIDHIGTLNAPLLMVAGKKDRHTTITESRALFAQASGPKEFWELADAQHEDFYAKQPVEYEKKILEFFDRHLGSSAKSSDKLGPPKQP